MTSPDFEGAPRRLDAAVDKAIREKRIVGTVVLLAQGGEILHRRAAGLADREAGRPMREDSLFLLASITKPIVTAAAMRLVEEGRLDLEAPVTRWLPEFRPRLPDGSAPEIRIRHLLTHTAGLSYRFLDPPEGEYRRLEVSDGLDQPGLSLAENLERLARAPLFFAPGEKWRYSLGMDVVGAAMERITGRSLRAIVRDFVTAPLGLKETDFAVHDSARLAKPYADGAPEPRPISEGVEIPLEIFNGSARFSPGRIFNPASYPSGGAGMAGSAGEILKFLEALRKGGAPILKPETFEAMARDQVGPQAKALGKGWGFGYGWAVLDDPARARTPQSAGTLQWGGAYGHCWFVDRARELTLVALTNVAFEGMSGAFPLEIRDAVYGFGA